MTWKTAAFEVIISNENIDTFVKFDNTEYILFHLPNDLFICSELLMQKGDIFCTQPIFHVLIGKS